jgi:hypothetical protein
MDQVLSKQEIAAINSLDKKKNPAGTAKKEAVIS